MVLKQNLNTKKAGLENSRQPLFPHTGVIALVPDDWDAPWMPRHQILSRLSRYFQVVWMNPPKGWRETWRPYRANAGRAFYSQSAADETLSIYTHGLSAPLFYKPKVLRRMTEKIRLRQAAQILRRRGVRDIILYIWRPEFHNALGDLPCQCSVYHIDDDYSFSENDQPLSDAEKKLLLGVDQVIIHSRGLLAKKGGLNANTAWVPNGVDYDAFAGEYDEPESLKSIPHPRIGYAGVLKKQLDFDMLLRLATANPHWSFVFVGPRLAHLQEQAQLMHNLEQRLNVHFLGAKPVRQLPCYVNHFDVGLLPYVVNDYTNCIYPLKLHEYLAAGLPVVGSAIRTLEEFDQTIRIARTEEQWSQAIAQSLSPDSGSRDRQAARRQIAKQHDWNLLTKDVAKLFCDSLGGDYSEKFKAAEMDPDSKQSVETGRSAATLPSLTHEKATL